MLLVMSGWRKTISFQHFSKASNVGLIIVGVYLFLFQMHGYTHTKFSEEFPLNKDDHYHIHKEMKKDEKPTVPKEVKKEKDVKKNVKTPKVHRHGSGSYHSH